VLLSLSAIAVPFHSTGYHWLRMADICNYKESNAKEKQFKEGVITMGREIENK
jgi:hypothetical protein